jgi:putative transposase
VLDLHTRKIVGWSMRETLHTEIALEALTMAIVPAAAGAGTNPPLRSRHSVCRRALSAGPRAIRHYTLDEPQRRLSGQRTNGELLSQLKTERVHHRIYDARGEARRDLFQYIEGFNNSRRLHRP